MQLPQIWAALSRHKLTALLLCIEVAIACAIVCNVMFLIADSVSTLNVSTGLDERRLVLVDAEYVRHVDGIAAHHDEDLARLRRLPGVESVVAVDALPLSGHNWTNGVTADPDGQVSVHASAYDGTPGELATLGLKLVAGRDFRPDEYIPMESGKGYAGIDHVPVAIISSALASRLFPDQDAVGRSIWLSDQPSRVVGVVDTLLGPGLGHGVVDHYSTLLPMVPDEKRVTYVLRTSPDHRAAVMKAATAALRTTSTQRVLTGIRAYTDLRDGRMRRTRTLLGTLVAVALCLIAVTAVGIFGLASYWVQQRRRQIGIRRAIGASRRDIACYFQVENFLVVGMGISLGMLMAYAFNAVLMRYYELPHLPLYYLPAGALVIWTLGQLAVLGPALRAAAVPPVVATRSV